MQRDRIIGPPEEQQSDGRSWRLCAAHGCPLPGSFSHSVLGAKAWFCFVHDGLEASHWQHATAEIHSRLPLLMAEFKGTKTYRASIRQRLIDECRPAVDNSTNGPRPAGDFLS